MKLQELKQRLAARLGITSTKASVLRRAMKSVIFSGVIFDFRTKQGVKDAIQALSHMSTDNISYIQAAKFAKRFNLTNVRIVNGLWAADDAGEAYTISAANYYGAIAEGDLAA